MNTPSGVTYHAPVFRTEARCTECRWNDTSADPRAASIAHTLERGHDTVVSMIGHVFYSKTPAAETATP